MRLVTGHLPKISISGFSQHIGRYKALKRDFICTLIDFLANFEYKNATLSFRRGGPRAIYCYLRRLIRIFPSLPSMRKI